MPKHQQNSTFLVLIDEEQNLVHEEAGVTFEEKQAFHWMASQSLKPVAKGALFDPGNRRRGG